MRLKRDGPSGYLTPDGRFRVVRRPDGWRITAITLADGRRLAVAGMDHPYATLREARAWLEGSIYGEHGWLRVPDARVRREVDTLERAPVERA